MTFHLLSPHPSPRSLLPRGPRSARHALPLLLALLLAPFALLLRGGDATPAMPSAPVTNFRLPTFTEEGWNETMLHADTALVISQVQINVTGLTLTLFVGDATNRVETVLTSPAATALTDQKIVRGDSTVRLVRDDLDVSGAQWSYAHGEQEKKILIGKDARVVFRAKLPDLLK